MMNKIIITGAFLLSIVFNASSQKLDDSKVPTVVKTSFAKQFTGVEATWEKEDGKYEASFKKAGSNYSAMFQPNGTFTESEIDIKVTDLPANVLAYVKEYYKGKTIKEGAKITKADGTVNYEAEVGGNDVLFDAGGKFLKVVKD